MKRSTPWGLVLLTVAILMCFSQAAFAATASARQLANISIAATAGEVHYQYCPAGDVKSQAFNIPGEGRLRIAHEVDPTPAPAYSGDGESSPAALGSGGGPGTTGGQAGGVLEGDWNFNGNGHTGQLRFAGATAQLRWSNGKVEQLKNFTFDPASGRVSFYRDEGEQPHTGLLMGDEIQGTFTQYGRTNDVYLWCAARRGSCVLGKALTTPNPQAGGATAAMSPPCATRPLTIPPPGGTLSTFEEGHIVPAGRYKVWVSPSADQRTASGPWRAFGPYDLLGGRKYLFFIRDGAVDGPIESDSRLNRYSNPSPDTTATYYENRSESRRWQAVTICPDGPVTTHPPAPPVQSPCATRPLTIPPPGGTLSTFEEGHIVPAGRYKVWVSPSADQRTASGPWRAFGPYELLGGRKYLFFIRDGAVDGPIESDSRLNRYSNPSPDTAATYYENRSESRRWQAVTICPDGPGTTHPGTGAGGKGSGATPPIDIIAGIWKNTDHIHQGCRVVENFCKAYKVDVLFSKEPSGALKGQLVGQQVFMVGYLQGQTWNFSTTMNGIAHGNGYFEFSPDFRSFKGELTDVNGDHHVVWTGKK